jgi:hypothetical protein
MTFAGATFVAGASGIIAGALVAFILRRGLRWPRVVVAGLSGAVLGALTFGFFVVFEFVTLLSGGEPSPLYALLLTVLLEAATIVAVLLSTWLPDLLPLPHSIDALLDSHPVGGPAQVWLIGVGLASLLIYFGLDCALSARAVLGTTMFHREVQGLPAVSYGIGWIAVGMFIHFHYFWTRCGSLRRYSRRAKFVSVVIASVNLTIAFYTAMGAGSAS